MIWDGFLNRVGRVWDRLGIWLDGDGVGHCWRGGGGGWSGYLLHSWLLASCWLQWQLTLGSNCCIRHSCFLVNTFCPDALQNCSKSSGGNKHTELG